MPRFNPFNRATWGVLGRHERRTLGPGYRRMRAGGRAEFTIFTKTPAKSRKAIQKTWSSFVSETSAHREVFFRHIFGQLTPQQNRMVARMGVTRDELVERLSHPSNQAYLRRVLGHNKVVEGTKVAADRFFLKNVSGVLLKGAKGRKGIFNFTPGSARDDIATGILAAVEQYGVPKAPGTTPTPTPTPPPTTPYGVTPPSTGAYGTPAIPPASPYGISAGDIHGTPLATPSDSAYGVEPASLTDLLLRPRRIKVAEFAHAGLQHHPESLPFYRTSGHEHKRREIARLMDAASEFLGDAFSAGLPKEETTRFVRHALNSDDYDDFAQRVVSQAKRSGYNPKHLDTFLPTSISSPISIESWHDLSMPRRQRNAVAFYLLAQLAKHGNEKNAGVHLVRFVRASHDDIRKSVRDWYALTHKPTTIRTEDLLRLLRRSLLHGEHERLAIPPELAAVVGGSSAGAP